jgi:hypothetical protein
MNKPCGVNHIAVMSATSVWQNLTTKFAIGGMYDKNKVLSYNTEGKIPNDYKSEEATGDQNSPEKFRRYIPHQ